MCYSSNDLKDTQTYFCLRTNQTVIPALKTLPGFKVQFLVLKTFAVMWVTAIAPAMESKRRESF